MSGKAQWAAHQVVEAFPWDTAPKYLMRDWDSIYAVIFRNRVKNMGIKVSRSKVHSILTEGEIKPNRFQFVFTPKHGSWLNLIETFFSKLTRTVLRHIRVGTKEELVERIYQGIDEINQTPVVFKWRYKMDEIAVS